MLFYYTQLNTNSRHFSSGNARVQPPRKALGDAATSLRLARREWGENEALRALRGGEAGGGGEWVGRVNEFTRSARICPRDK